MTLKPTLLNGFKLPFTDGDDNVLIDNVRPSALVISENTSQVESFMRAVTLELELYDKRSHKLEFLSVDDTTQDVAIKDISRKVSKIKQSLQAANATTVRELDNFKVQTIVLLDITNVHNLSDNMSTLITDLLNNAHHYGYYFILTYKKDSLHKQINPRDFTIVISGRVSYDTSVQIFGHPFASVLVHPKEFLFRYQNRELEKELNGCIVTL